MFEGIAVLVVVLFILVKFSGLITRSVNVVESTLGSVLTAADNLSEVAEDSSKTYAYKMKQHNAQVRGDIYAELKSNSV